MPKIDERIRDIDKTICQNIDLIDFETVSRALVSQNLLSQSRNLVEHVAVKAYADAKGEDLEADWETIPAATEYIKHHNKFQFLRKFHNFLQESKSHYTPDGEGAERLVLKYYKFYMILRNFVKQEYQMDILHNLEKFPINTDHAVQEYHDKIAERLELRREIRDLTHNPRMYVHKVVPFVSGEAVYYEIVLTPAYDTTSKFDRFVCYSKIMIPSHYSAKMDIYYETIEVNGRKMPVNILTDFMVSIRPCELNNFAKIFGDDIKMSPSHSEYIGMMQYLSNSGASLLDIVTAPRDIYNLIKQKMFGKSQVHYFENVLDKCRRLIRTKGAGSTTVRYLLHTLNNKVIKNQLGSGSCWKLSDLYLDWGCIPFDQMPFATSLRQHNPESAELFGSLSADNRKHEFVARYILSNMSTNAVLYTPVKELEEYTDNLDAEITAFNNRLYFKHTNRRIEKFGQNLYIQGAFQNTKKIIDKLKEMSTEGIPEYQEDVSFWLDLIADVDSEEKKNILQNMFDKTKVSLIYGAAGTGKTYLINHIANYMREKSILFLANTNPAVENLRRKVTAIDPQKCEFMTIKKFLMSRYNRTDYDILVMDYLKEKYKGIFANNIYVRLQDSNTPVDKSADFHHVEYLWKKRFGMLLSPIEKVKLYLKHPEHWANSPSSEDKKYYKYAPEFTIDHTYEPEDDRTGYEYYLFAQTDSRPHWSEIRICYHQTVLAELGGVILDGGRYFTATPDRDGISLTEYHNWDVPYRYMVKGRLNHLVHEFYYVDDGDEARHSHNEYEGCILIFEDEKEHQRFRIYVRENWYRKDAFANDIWIPHMEQLPGYNMDAFREEYLNMQILRKMLEEFRKNDNTKN